MSRGDFVRGDYVRGGFCPTPRLVIILSSFIVLYAKYTRDISGSLDTISRLQKLCVRAGPGLSRRYAYFCIYIRQYSQ